MVCVPCLVIPFLLWVFHKYIRPIVMKFWPWSKQEKLERIKSDETKVHSNGVNGTSNGVVAKKQVTVGDTDAGKADKKNN